jgi:uncharacterized protein
VAAGRRGPRDFGWRGSLTAIWAAALVGDIMVQPPVSEHAILTAAGRAVPGDDGMTDFTPWASLGGGALIGLSAVLLMAFHGRVMGVTGILGGLLRFNDAADWTLRAAVLCGMVAGPMAIPLLLGWTPAVEMPISTAEVILGGVIVGVGVSYGGGCTSGHGVCGNARFSRRSMVATAVFMATAFATVFVTRHLLGD